MRKRIKYSQNFLKDGKLVKGLIDKASLDNQDIVYEIGAGQGIITEQLMSRAKKVVAFEIDGNLAGKLKDKFGVNNNLEVINSDFLKWRLPDNEYKVFSNIPFNITADVAKKLLFDNNPPSDCYLIMQTEAAKKFVGKPLDYKNSLVAILAKVNFDITLFHKFNRNDFYPRPAVDTSMIRFNKLENPHVESQNKDLFYDFVSFGFGQFEPNILKGLSKIMPVRVIDDVCRKQGFSSNLKPSGLSFENWLSLFEVFKAIGNKTKISGTYKALLNQQTKLQKVHRTRLDKNWRDIHR